MGLCGPPLAVTTVTRAIPIPPGVYQQDVIPDDPDEFARIVGDARRLIATIDGHPLILRCNHDRPLHLTHSTRDDKGMVSLHFE